MNFLIATDAWAPQVNGVVRTLETITEELEKLGHTVSHITPEGRPGMDMPFYSEIRLGHISQSQIGEIMDRTGPDGIYIATEGPIGWAVRKWCVKHDVAFATGFHTRFADYVAERVPLPGTASLIWRILRRFHSRSGAVLTPTPSMAEELRRRGFERVIAWTRGVDHARFRVLPDAPALQYAKPILLSVGRVAVEKNLEAFLKLDTPGTKLIVGDGPQRAELERKYPDAVFLGYRFGEDLVETINGADLFVFSSRTDTFGLVILEAMACGLPVAAYPVTGPIDVVEQGVSGILDEDLGKAIEQALILDSKGAIDAAAQYSWENTARQFAEVVGGAQGIARQPRYTFRPSRAER